MPVVTSPIITATNYTPLASPKLSSDPLFQLSKPVEGFDAVKDGEIIAQKIKDTAKLWVDEITLNKNKLTELQTLEDKTQALIDSLQPLTNYLGIVSTTPNVFKQKTAVSLQTDNSVAITVGANATISEVPIKLIVTQLAAYDQIGSSNASPADYFTSIADGLSLSGNLVINGTTIPITDGTADTPNMSLQNIADAINTANSGVTAQIITISNVGGVNQYRLVITAKEIATPIDLSGTDPAISTGLKLSDVATDVDTLLAKFTFNGDHIVRNTNTVTDLIPDLTFDLVNVSTTGVQAVIKPDRNALIQAVTTFVSAYNDLNDEMNRHIEKGPDGKPLPDAVLEGHQILDAVRSALSQGINTTVLGATEGDYITFASIGLTVGAGSDGKTSDLSGKMYLDQGMLEKAVYENYGQVQRLLGNHVTSTGSNFAIRELPAKLSSVLAGKEISVNYQQNLDGTFQATLSVDGYDPVIVMLDPTRNRIIEGPKGSIFAGLTIAYSGAIPTAGGAPVSESVSGTQGVADSFMNLLSPLMVHKLREDDPLQGDFEIAREMIIQQNKTRQERIDDIYAKADRTKQDLIMKMERVYKYQQMLQETDQMLEAMHAALMGRR